MNSRSSETYSSVRIQVWHQTEGHKGAQSDGASFVTAGTALSGPQREKMLPNSSRIMVYLGRLNEYITVFSKSSAIRDSCAQQSVRNTDTRAHSHGRYRYQSRRPDDGQTQGEKGRALFQARVEMAGYQR